MRTKTDEKNKIEIEAENQSTIVAAHSDAEKQDQNDAHPSAVVAYDLSIKSYELTERRLVAVESRNEKILSYVSSLTLAVVAFLASSSSQNLNIKSCLFVIALICGFLSLLISLATMLLGRIIFFDIATIKNKWIHLKEVDFKKEMLIKSSNDFDTNYKVIEKKALATSIIGFLYYNYLRLAIICSFCFHSSKVVSVWRKFSF
jgi:hypothetical protein